LGDNLEKSGENFEKSGENFKKSGEDFNMLVENLRESGHTPRCPEFTFQCLDVHKSLMIVSMRVCVTVLMPPSYSYIPLSFLTNEVLCFTQFVME
jgi:hypothetical protein